MLKNVKIDQETHKQLRMRAAKLDCKLSDLCSIAIRQTLASMDDSSLEALLLSYDPDKEESTKS